MAFTVEIKRRALRTIEELDQERKKVVQDALLVLKDDPVPFRRMDVVKLRGYDNIYRIRVGQLRIVYAVLWRGRKILIHFVGPRESAYE